MIELAFAKGLPVGIPAFGRKPLLAMSPEVGELAARHEPRPSGIEVTRLAQLHPLVSGCTEGIVREESLATALNTSFVEPQLDAVAKGSGSLVSAAKLLLAVCRNEEALQLLKDHLSDSSGYWVRHYYAIALGRCERVEDAKEYLRLLSDDYPRDPRPRHALAKLWIGEDGWSEARGLLLTAAKSRDASAELLSDLGVTCIMDNKIADAIRHLRRALRRNERSTLALTNLGVCHRVENRATRANKFFQEALACNPRCVPAALNLAESFLAEGKLEEAAELLERQRELVPEDPQVQERLAWTYLEMQRPRKAKELLLGAAKRSSKPLPGILNNLALTYAASDDAARAERTFEEAVTLVSHEPTDELALSVRSNYAYFLTRLNRWTDVVRVLPPEMAATDVAATLLVVPALLETDRVEAAADILERALDDHPRDERLLLSLSYTLSSRLGQPERAVALLESVGDLARADLSLANNFAYACLKLGRLQEAQEILRPHLDDAGDRDNELSICLMATWGLLRIRQGEYQEGLQWYRNAKSLSRGRLRARLEQKMAVEEGRRLLNSERRQSAFAKLRRAASGPDAEFAEEARELMVKQATLH